MTKQKQEKLSVGRIITTLTITIPIFAAAYFLGIKGLITSTPVIYTGGRYGGDTIELLNPNFGIFASTINMLTFGLTGLGVMLWGFNIFPPTNNFFDVILDQKINPRIRLFMKIYYFMLIISLTLYCGMIIFYPLWEISPTTK